MTPVFPGIPKAVIGMIHLHALPGTPHYGGNLAEINRRACHEAEIYRDAGVDAVVVENMNDRPFLKTVGPEIVSTMTAAALAVRQVFQGPCGVQVLAGANEESLAIALAAKLDFIRAEGFVFAHVADEGWIESNAGRLLRARKSWNAEHIRIFADIKKKHAAHAITADVNFAETAHAAEFFCSDGIIVTGAATGKPVDPADLAEAAEATSLPLLAGSGATIENVASLFEHAGAVIVGSTFKHDGDWRRPVDPERVRRFMERVRAVRAGIHPAGQ